MEQNLLPSPATVGLTDSSFERCGCIPSRLDFLKKEFWWFTVWGDAMSG